MIDQYRALRAIGKLHGTIKRALALRSQRAALAAEMEAINGKMAPGRFAARAAIRRKRRATETVVALGNQLAAESLAAAKRQYPRLREWSLGAKAGPGTRIREIGSNSDWNKRSTFQRGIIVRSVATCENRKVAVYRLARIGDPDKVTEVPAPRGYLWDVDSLGLKLCGAAGEYHPTGDELLAGAKAIVAALKGAAQTRRREARKARQQLQVIRRAEREGAAVCLRDSLRAGNCAAGSEAFARQHGIRPDQHVRPSRLLKLANGQAERVALVVAVALRRHALEMQRGFCSIGDHQR